MIWQITDKGDPITRRIVDGEGFGGIPHYSRQSPGTASYTRNGQNLVFLSVDARAVWVTFRPTPGKAVRPDGLDAWENAVFCSRGSVFLASEMIAEAVELSCAIWGPLPADGLITFIKPAAIRSPNPGYCYKCAGWTRTGNARDGKPRLSAPAPVTVRPLSAWQYAPNRGGKLRSDLRTLAIPRGGQLELKAFAG